MIVYTKYAEEKFRILKEQGFVVKKKNITFYPVRKKKLKNK
jgi:hypothetical protein